MLNNFIRLSRLVLNCSQLTKISLGVLVMGLKDTVNSIRLWPEDRSWIVFMDCKIFKDKDI